MDRCVSTSSVCSVTSAEEEYTLTGIWGAALNPRRWR